MTIGEIIRQYRKEKGLTQKELGALVGMTQSAIGQFETSPSLPKLSTIEKFANALQVPIHDLVPDISPDDYSRTNEYRILESYAMDDQKIHEGILALIAKHYGSIMPQSVHDEVTCYGGDYFLVDGKGKCFVLHKDAIFQIQDLLEASIGPVVEMLADRRDISIIQKELCTPPDEEIALRSTIEGLIKEKRE